MSDKKQQPPTAGSEDPQELSIEDLDRISGGTQTSAGEEAQKKGTSVPTAGIAGKGSRRGLE